MIIIDRAIKNENLDLDILEVLYDLHIAAIRIIMTAHYDTDNLMQCLKYGIRYYLDKGDQSTPVFLRALESAVCGLEEKRRTLVKESIDKEGREHIYDHFEQYYKQYRGQFIAIGKNGDGWHVVAANESLFGLYSTIGKEKNALHITLIR